MAKATALPSLLWTCGAEVTLASGAIGDVIDGIGTAFTNSTYHRVLDSGAGSYVHVGPKATSAGSQWRAIIGHQALVSNWTMWLDTFEANVPHIIMAPYRGSTLTFDGALDDAAPWGAADVTKYVKIGDDTAAVTYQKVTLYENDEYWMLILKTSTPSYFGCVCGPAFQPYASGYAEADNLLYGILTSSATAIGPSLCSLASQGFAGVHSASNNLNHCGVMLPGVTSMTAITKSTAGIATTVVDTSAASEYIYSTPMEYGLAASPWHKVGFLRNAYWAYSSGLYRRALESSAGVKEYWLFAADASSEQEGIAMDAR